VAERVVDVGEVVQVDQRQRQALGLAHALLEQFEEAVAVGQLQQLVVVGVVEQLAVHGHVVEAHAQRA
jgi:hypothetical protein